MVNLPDVHTVVMKLAIFSDVHGNHIFPMDHKLLVNVASVGFRTDGLCKFITVDYLSGHVSVVQHSVPFDAAEEERLNALEGVPEYFAS